MNFRSAMFGMMLCLAAATLMAQEMVFLDLRQERDDKDYVFGQAKVTYTEKEVTFEGPHWHCGFGFFGDFESDLSGQEQKSLVMKVKPLQTNRLKTLAVELVSDDGVERKSVYHFKLRGLAVDEFHEVVATTALNSPVTKVEGGADLSNIKLVNIVGVMQDAPHRPAVVIDTITIREPKAGS